MVIKIDQKALDKHVHGVRSAVFGEGTSIVAADTRGKFRPYTMAVHGECLLLAADGSPILKGIAVDPAAGAADERYLKDMEGAEERLGKVAEDIRARKEEVKQRVLDRNDLVTNTLRATVLDPRTAPDVREQAQAMLDRIDKIVLATNSSIRDRARNTAELNGRVAALETDNARLRERMVSEDVEAPPPAPKGRRRRAPR